MSGVRKLVGFLMVLLLAAFALPAAAQKVYTLNLSSPSPLQVGGTGQSVTATMNNISPDTGNSTIKSFKLFAPSGLTITAPASGVLVPLGNGYTATIQNNGGSIYVSNINVPLKPFGQALVVSMKVDLSCSASGGTWTIQGPWNGGAFTGQTFSQQSPSNMNTPVSGACTYSTTFLTQPKKTFAGYPITNTAFNNPAGSAIQVQLQLNGAAPPTTLVTLTSACALSGNSASTNASGVATFSSLSVGTAATGCRLTASFGSSAATSDPFDIVASQGILSCDPNDPNNSFGTLDPDAIPPLGDPAFGLARGLNTDGNCGDPVPFTFTINATDRSASFTEDSLGQHPSVEYIIRWPAVDVDADGWSAKQPCVSWGVPDPNFVSDPVYGCSGTGSDYVPAIACAVNNVDGGDAVMPDIPNVAPFTGNPHTQYQPTSVTGNKAKVCVSQQGWTSSGGMVQYWTKLIDQSDTGIRLP